MTNLLSKRILYVIGTVSLIALIGVTQPAMALDGPEQGAPLGTDVVDTDCNQDPESPTDGCGEQWGREGGRAQTFIIHDVSAYNQLEWRPTNVAIAFDGTIDTASETLTYDRIENGQAIWVGESTISVKANGNNYDPVTIGTEFILTVQDDQENLVEFETVNGIPTVNLITTLTPNESDQVEFTVTLEMRAEVPPHSGVTSICPYLSLIVGGYYPALDVYDCLHTDPSQERPVITTFESGFFYELLVFGLEEHDAHMEEIVGNVQTTVGQIYSWTDFIYNDWGRIEGMTSDHMEIRNSIAVMGGTLNNVSNTVDQINAKVDSLGGDDGGENNVLNELSEIRSRVEEIPDTQLLLFGLLGFINPDSELNAYQQFVYDSSPIYQNFSSLNGMLTGQGQQNADNLATLTTQLQDVLELLETQGQMIADLNAQIQTLLTDPEPDPGDPIGDPIP